MLRPAVRRQRRVEIDFARVWPAGDGPSAARSAERFTLNLFSDVCVIARRERATELGGGAVQWEGRLGIDDAFYDWLTEQLALRNAAFAATHGNQFADLVIDFLQQQRWPMDILTPEIAAK